MRPEEREEKIIARLHGDCGCTPYMHSTDRNFIAAEIRAAVEEAIADFSKDANIVLETSVDAAKADAYADAARIAREFATTLIFSSDGLMTMDEAMKVAKMLKPSDSRRDSPTDVGNEK